MADYRIHLKKENDKAAAVHFQPEQEFKKVQYIGQADGSVAISIGLGETSELDRIRVKEIGAVAAKTMETLGNKAYGVCAAELIGAVGTQWMEDLAEGLALCTDEQEITIFGADFPLCVQKAVEERLCITQSIFMARELVNCPGNRLRPTEFAAQLDKAFADTKVETETISCGQLKEMGMGGLAGIGESSEFLPCLYIMRYQGNPDTREITGLVGKGVTCDTGGYCLKPSGSMAGIKGDMAGGAAVAGAILALAKNREKVNVTGIIPMCENRISPASILPGDVITAYSGDTIEVLNTDAEGRLILADAVNYGVRREKLTSVLDIATLTGAVVNMLGFSVTGMLSDSKELKKRLLEGAAQAGERCWELPFYEEHERMLKSKVADIKNIGGDCCGTITAGLFIRHFAKGTPWIHLDIAGTAWVGTPVFEFQKEGATGAGVSTLYYYCKSRGE